MRILGLRFRLEIWLQVCSSGLLAEDLRLMVKACCYLTDVGIEA